MTPFGAFCRNLRIHHSVSLKTQAAALSVSPTYLSALERGKKGKPSKEIIRKIGEYYTLSADEQKQLQDAARVSSTTVKIPQNANMQTYRVVNMLAEYAASFSKTELDMIEVMLASKQQKETKAM